MDPTVTPITKTLALGMGNAMLSDLGTGIEIIHRLRRRQPRSPHLDLARAGLVNVSLGQLISGYANLIVVESRPIGGEPGNIVEMQGTRMDEFLKQQAGDDAMLADILSLLEPTGRRPLRRALMVVQPASARVEHGLSPEVTAALPRLIDMVLQRAADWNGLPGHPSGAAIGRPRDHVKPANSN
jgi:hydrogenase maturation protease